MGWGPGLNQKKEASWAATFGACCFLTVDVMWPVASRSCHHALPTMMDYTPSLLRGLVSLPLVHGFCQVCCHSNTKSNWSVACPRIKSRSVLENELVKSPYPHITSSVDIKYSLTQFNISCVKSLRYTRNRKECS